MNFCQKQSDELENILREDFGIELNKKELTEIAGSLVRYFDLLAKIDYSDKIKK